MKTVIDTFRGRRRWRCLSGTSRRFMTVKRRAAVSRSVDRETADGLRLIGLWYHGIHRLIQVVDIRLQHRIIQSGHFRRFHLWLMGCIERIDLRLRVEGRGGLDDSRWVVSILNAHHQASHQLAIPTSPAFPALGCRRVALCSVDTIPPLPTFAGRARRRSDRDQSWPIAGLVAVNEQYRA